MKMNLTQTYDLLLTLPSGRENASVFKTTYEHYQFKNDENLKAYLEFIKDNTIEWFSEMPERWKSLTQLSKPKTALIKLLKNEEIAKEVGDEYAQELITTINGTWKKYMHDLSDSRQKSITNSVKTPEETSEKTEQEDEEKTEEDSEEYDFNPDQNDLIRENLILVAKLEKFQKNNEYLKQLFFEYVKTKEDEKMHSIWFSIIQNLKISI